MTNTSSEFSDGVDPFEENKAAVYSFLGIVMSVAISLNIASCVIMTKNKDLRKHNQFLVYITISFTEIFIDVLYIISLYWRRRGVEHFCMFVFLLLCVGRESILVHLLYLCIERCFALTVSLNRIFRKMITVRGRILVFGINVTLSILLFAPIVLAKALKDPYTCGPDHLFGSEGGFVLRYCRTVFSLQIVAMLVIYLYIAKKIHTITAPNVSKTDQPRPVNHTRVHPQDSKPNQETGVYQINSENQTISHAMTVETVTCKTSDETTDNARNSDKTPNTERKNKAPVGKWKPRTLKMLRSVLLTTVIPSIPMIGLQIVEYFDPSFMTATLDVIISLCNVLHAIIFPLVFVVTVTQSRCCKNVRT